MLLKSKDRGLGERSPSLSPQQSEIVRLVRYDCSLWDEIKSLVRWVVLQAPGNKLSSTPFRCFGYPLNLVRMVVSSLTQRLDGCCCPYLILMFQLLVSPDTEFAAFRLLPTLNSLGFSQKETLPATSWKNPAPVIVWDRFLKCPGKRVSRS